MKCYWFRQVHSIFFEYISVFNLTEFKQRPQLNIFFCVNLLVFLVAVSKYLYEINHTLNEKKAQIKMIFVFGFCPAYLWYSVLKLSQNSAINLLALFDVVSF